MQSSTVAFASADDVEGMLEVNDRKGLAVLNLVNKVGDVRNRVERFSFVIELKSLLST